jgi:Dit-like phage tail protein
MSALFPNVPNLPGVPAVPRLPGSAVGIGVAIASGVISSLLGQAAKKPLLWGIFDSSNKLALAPDSVLEFSHRKHRDISDFPVIPGSFASYNKVDLPFDIQIRLAKGSKSSDRATLLKQVEALVESIQLYTVVTPERTYKNCNLGSYEITRGGPSDAYFLKQVDLTFVEILQASAQYTNTGINTSNAQSAAALPTSNVGTVQTQPPSGVLASSGTSATQSAGQFPSLF